MRRGKTSIMVFIAHSPPLILSLISQLGSFGTFPTAIRDKLREYQDLCESTPDPYIRYLYPKLLDTSREAVAKILNAPVETVVFVPNATTGVNTVLRNIVWHKDGKDEILHFSTIYGACGKTVAYVSEASGDLVKGRQIEITYPAEDSDIVGAFKSAIRASRAERKFPRIAVFDTVSSLPGLRVPFQQLTAICREEGILSLIDGAHGIGHIHLDLSALDPDFFVSNCHKWLYVPRGCAVFYVPVRNQAIMRSTLPTSHGFVPRADQSVGLPNPLESFGKSEYISNFAFVGTIENSNYLLIPDAIKWREEVCGGEQAIIEYNTKLAKEAGKVVADILGTSVMDNSTNTLSDCCLANVALPLTASAERIAGKSTVKPEFAMAATVWMQKTLVDEYKTFIAIFYFQGQWWTRLSAQIYLDLSDFEWAGKILKEICERAAVKDEF
jgi:selenocysteine lyase/cysteine desulfurase